MAPQMPVADTAVLCAAAWTLNGVIGSQLSDVQTVIDVHGQDMTVSQYIDGTFGFTQDSIWYVWHSPNH